MKLILVASSALAAYLVSSAEAGSITMILSRCRLNGAYRARIVSSSRGSCTPITIRSPWVKSATAAPSLRNSGLEHTPIRGARPSGKRASSSSRISSRTRAAVPTGTVDLSATSRSPSAHRPMVRATACTAERSAAPSGPCGVPTAISATSAWSRASAASTVKASRPEASPEASSGSRPGSQIGHCPSRSRRTRSASMSAHTTRCPPSARQAPVTSPTYPEPNTAMRIRAPLLRPATHGPLIEIIAGQRQLLGARSGAGPGCSPARCLGVVLRSPTGHPSPEAREAGLP